MQEINCELDLYKKCIMCKGIPLSKAQDLLEYIEHCLISENEGANYSFHKILVNNWTDSCEELFDVMSEFYCSTPNSLIPINVTSQGSDVTFYTSNLILIQKIIKQDFTLPHKKKKYYVTIKFNYQTSDNFWGEKLTVAEIISGVVSRRFSNTFTLDLSNFSNDPELLDKRINFYKISLLAHFKILMLRIGRDTVSLNLSNNKLSIVPVDVMNFFIKGDLTSVDLSNNYIPTIRELLRVNSKIEKLRIEGNPFCDELEPVTYIKTVMLKFPRLAELDGVKINEFGLPFLRNYLCSLGGMTQKVVDDFISLYFSYYDSRHRRQIGNFYDLKAKLSITTDFTPAQARQLPHYTEHCRNLLGQPRAGRGAMDSVRRCFAPVAVHSIFPDTQHDVTTFTVDVPVHNSNVMVLVIDGVFKEKCIRSDVFNIFQFRRTFVFNIFKQDTYSAYHIMNEMYHIAFATKSKIDCSFKTPIRNMNSYALRSPEPEDIEMVVKLFTHLTQLKKPVAAFRLKIHDWDIEKALKDFVEDMKNDLVSADKFADHEEADSISDISLSSDDDILD